MDFSVIMAVYIKDKADDFRVALESISTIQTVKPKEIIVVEDGPVEPMIENVFYELASLNSEIDFVLIKKDVGEGLASALNTAIDNCKYDWIFRMDSDDCSSHDRFRLQISYLKEHPDISVLGSCIDEFEKNIGDINSRRIVPEKHEDIIKMIKNRNPMNHMTVCYKKAAVVDCGKYDTNFGKLEDYKLWIDLFCLGYKFANIQHFCVHARIGNGFISRRSNKKEIKDWDKLQYYLYHKKIISFARKIINMVKFRLFTYMPPRTKSFIYRHFLRKRI